LLRPLILITGLFFLWALGVNLNDILIPHLKKAFRLTDLQSSLIQTAFFGGYFLAALPAGWLMERIGYKKESLRVCSSAVRARSCLFPLASLLVYGFFSLCAFRDGVRSEHSGSCGQPVRHRSGSRGKRGRRLNFRNPSIPWAR